MSRTPTLTIRGLDDATRQRLRLAAAERGVSMEEEMRGILRAALAAGPAHQKSVPAASPPRPSPFLRPRMDPSSSSSAAASPPTSRSTSSAGCASAAMPCAW